MAQQQRSTETAMAGANGRIRTSWDVFAIFSWLSATVFNNNNMARNIFSAGSATTTMATTAN
jgi:hypothetical protein